MAWTLRSLTSALRARRSAISCSDLELGPELSDALGQPGCHPLGRLDLVAHLVFAVEPAQRVGEQRGLVRVLARAKMVNT
jgi:hypothetical protein